MSVHDARTPQSSHRLVGLRWRTGGSVGRTIYGVYGEGPDSPLARDDDALLIGVMDTAELAEEAVRCHNRVLEMTPRRPSK